MKLTTAATLAFTLLATSAKAETTQAQLDAVEHASFVEDFSYSCTGYAVEGFTSDVWNTATEQMMEKYYAAVDAGHDRRDVDRMVNNGIKIADVARDQMFAVGTRFHVVETCKALLAKVTGE